MLLSLSLACAPDVPEEEDTVVAAEPLPELDALLDGLARCQPGSDDGRLDLEEGCADGVCFGASLDEAEAVFGAPTCESIFDTAICTYAGGVEIFYADSDYDGAPDADAQAYEIALSHPWDGGTTGGLARDASFRCFPEQLGTPDSLYWSREGEDWEPRSMAWDSWYFSISDSGDPAGEGDADGLPERLVLSNYLYY